MDPTQPKNPPRNTTRDNKFLEQDQGTSSQEVPALKHNLELVRQRIAAACLASQRSPSSVELLPVSKAHPAVTIAEAYELGLHRFGENYLQELEQKAAQLLHLPKLAWVFIGAVQSNKIKQLVQHCSEIQTLCSEKHFRYVARYAEELGKVPFPVYICVNAAAEPQKSGVLLQELPALTAQVQTEFPQLDLQGIMAIPPERLAHGTEVPELYRTLSRVAHGVGRGKLSLGMSSDLELAVAAGSNCLRIGTDIFGTRH